MIPLSVVILSSAATPVVDAAIDQLPFSDDIVVVGGGAVSHPNVRHIARDFDTDAEQLEFALHQVEYKHPWLLLCDPHDRFNSDLIAEIEKAISAAPPNVAAFQLRMITHMGGRRLRFAANGARWQARLLRPERVGVHAGAAQPQPIIDGHCPQLSHAFIRDEFQSGLRPWLEQHNLESTRAARQALIRRRSSIPLRWLARFIWIYFCRGGIFDGRAGLQYCLLLAMTEYWTGLKIYEGESDFNRRGDALVARMLADDTATSPAAAPAPPVDVLIPTLNESAHIAEAVSNARQLGPVFVLDSMSSDGTQLLARQAGATVVEHPFTDYAAQKNWGLANIPFTGQFVFILDADERITPQLRLEIRAKLMERPQVNGYIVNRLPIFMGQKLQHGGLYPSWNLRLFKRGLAHYENRTVHEHVICRGPTELLHDQMLHLRRESMTRFIDKHIRYADMESNEWLKSRRGNDNGRAARTGQLFSSVLRYRQVLRRYVWRHLPARPLWRFIYMFFFAFGFLDGKPGLHSAALMACYEHMIACLYREKSARRN